MADRYESWVDKQIREAIERGEFDNLPGTGKPLPDRNERYDENWWLKQWIAREGIRGDVALPTTLRLRREIEDIANAVKKMRSEADARELVSDLNRRIVEALRGHVDGPPVPLRPVNADEVVRRWREGD
jgi:Domain of unknown function (DUF1992)